MKVMWLILKDLKVETRRCFEILASISFVLISSLLISYASHYTTIELIVPSLWLVITFIAVFTSTMSFTREVDSKTLYGLKLLPISAQTVFISKVVFTFILIVIQGFIAVFALVLFSGYIELLKIIWIFLIFSAYISVVSAFSSALVMYSEGRGYLMPMLIFIFTVPILMALIKQDLPVLILEVTAMSCVIISLASYVLEV